VRYATDRTGTWAVTTVGQLPTFERLNGIDLAVDGLGAVHIVGSELDSGVGAYRWTMRHFTDASGTWTADTLPITGGHTVSLAARGAGRLLLVYRAERQVTEADIQRSLAYATNATASGSWLMRTLGGEDTRSGAITLDRDRKVHIAYVRTGAAVGLYHRTNASGAWVTQRINRHDVVGAPDIAALDAGHLEVAYARAGDRPGIRIASKEGTVWSSVSGSTHRFDRSPSLALLPSGSFRVVFDRDSDGLFLLSE
jgi:hypothetical protein